MRQTNICKRSDGRYPVAKTLGAIVGVIVLLALGDVFIVLALALAAAVPVAAWWIRHNARRRTRSGDVALASISHLPASHCGSKKASAHTPWHRHDAA